MQLDLFATKDVMQPPPPPIYHARITYDADAESPRCATNLGLLACWHRRYRLGDVQPKETSQVWLQALTTSGAVILPVYMYDHSSLTLRTTPFACRWDSGLLGYIIATAEAIRTTLGWRRVTAKRRRLIETWLRAEVALYSSYLQGDVWRYEVVAADDATVVDSMGGFYADALEDILAQAAPQHHTALRVAWETRTC